MDLKALFESFLDRAMHPVILPETFARLPEHGVRAGAYVKNGYTFHELQQQRPLVPSRDYTFDDAESFTSFLLRSHSSGDAFSPNMTEIAGRDGTLVAINKVAHERHQVTMSLKYDDAWKFWCENDDSEFTIAELRRLLKARRNDLHDKSVTATLQDVAVNIANGAEVRVDPKTNLVTYAGQKKSVEVTGTVPDSITLAIPVYAGQPVQKVVIDLEPSIDEKTEKPEQRLKLKLSIVDIETTKRAAWEERVAKVRELLGPEWLVGLGKLGFEGK